MVRCDVKRWACVRISTGQWEYVTDDNVDRCSLTQPIAPYRWDCDDPPTATISATIQSTVELGTQSAVAMQGMAYINWIGFGLIIFLLSLPIGWYAIRR